MHRAMVVKKRATLLYGKKHLWPVARRT